MLSELTAAIESHLDSRAPGDDRVFRPMDGVVAAMAGNVVLVKSSKDIPNRRLYRPALCVVARGAKQAVLGDEVIDYAEGTALVVSVELPGFGRVTRASEAAPYLGVTIEFDFGAMREVLQQLETPPRPSAGKLGLFVETLSDPMLDCVLRLVRALSTPSALPVLQPAIMRELYFWLLTGPNGGELCKLVQADSHAKRIADAIYWLRAHFTKPIRVEDMARAAGMGLSSFHHHFKTLTAMTPLQFQKELRLLEARRLMVTEAANVTRAALEVGYESPSQFSREYTRMFGTPPKRDAMALKAMGVPVR